MQVTKCVRDAIEAVGDKWHELIFPEEHAAEDEFQRAINPYIDAFRSGRIPQMVQIGDLRTEDLPDERGSTNNKATYGPTWFEIGIETEQPPTADPHIERVGDMRFGVRMFRSKECTLADAAHLTEYIIEEVFLTPDVSNTRPQTRRSVSGARFDAAHPGGWATVPALGKPKGGDRVDMLNRAIEALKAYQANILLPQIK